MKELQRKLGVTTIMVTHDQEEALSMADRIVVMNHGVIEQIGTPTEICRHPATLFVADFIGETNQIASRHEPGAVTVGRTLLETRQPGLADGQQVVVVVRPEDILPHARGREATSKPNHLSVRIAGMEFLGSYWRVYLSSGELGDTPLKANFSMNAVRRLDLQDGSELTVELPAERVLVFAQEG
jgi:iron(III) transport system ATP-binding protein